MNALRAVDGGGAFDYPGTARSSSTGFEYTTRDSLLLLAADHDGAPLVALEREAIRALIAAADAAVGVVDPSRIDGGSGVERTSEVGGIRRGLSAEQRGLLEAYVNAPDSAIFDSVHAALGTLDGGGELKLEPEHRRRIKEWLESGHRSGERWEIKAALRALIAVIDVDARRDQGVRAQTATARGGEYDPWVCPTVGNVSARLANSVFAVPRTGMPDSSVWPWRDVLILVQNSVNLTWHGIDAKYLARIGRALSQAPDDLTAALLAGLEALEHGCALDAVHRSAIERCVALVDAVHRSTSERCVALDVSGVDALRSLLQALNVRRAIEDNSTELRRKMEEIHDAIRVLLVDAPEVSEERTSEFVELSKIRGPHAGSGCRCHQCRQAEALPTLITVFLHHSKMMTELMRITGDMREEMFAEFMQAGGAS